MSPSTSRHTRGSREILGRTVPSTARRQSRLRVTFLAFVWALPAVCCAVHVVAHELTHELGHGAPDAPFAADRIVGMSGDHDHRHEHLDSPSVLSTEGAKKLDGSALFIAAAELDSPRVTRPRHEDAATSRSLRTASVVSGPRAPPIS